MKTIVMLALAMLCAAATVVWIRSARHRLRLMRRVEADFADEASRVLARSAFEKEAHAALLYGMLALASLVMAFATDVDTSIVYAVIVLPAVISLFWARSSVREAWMARQRFEIERRAEEALEQEELAPRAWAGRLAPDDLPDLSGFEIGRVYQAGSGLMAGDFFDVIRVAPTRVAAVIGDVAGHGIESSITAFQAKYLLRIFLRQFRDPAQALEELNEQMSRMDRGEEFISLAVIVFDTGAGTLRYASAGHPTAFLWHAREVQPLRSTGPLVMLDPKGSFYSREIPLAEGDLALMYTDGLAEVRSGDDLFGEERIAQALRRDPGVAADVLCKSLLDAARDFADGVIRDDVAILAIRRL